MIKEFTNNGYRYILSSPSLVLSKIKLNGKDISKYLSNQTKVAWYDVSKNSGWDTTNADETMVLNVINTKWRIDLVTRVLTEDEIVDFYEEIIKAPTMQVDFLNPFTKNWQTIYDYRGDHAAQAMHPYITEDGLKELFTPVSQAIIEW